MSHPAPNNTQKIIDATKKRRNNPRGPRLLSFFQQKANEQKDAIREKFHLNDILEILKKTEYKKNTCLRKGVLDYNKIINSDEFRQKLTEGAKLYLQMELISGNPDGLFNQQGLQMVSQMSFLNSLCDELHIKVLSPIERMQFEETRRLQRAPTALTAFRASISSLDDDILSKNDPSFQLMALSGLIPLSASSPRGQF